MKNLRPVIFICLLCAALSCVLSCSNTSTGPTSQYDFPAPIDSVATDISLYVYSDIYGAFAGSGKLTSTDGLAPVIRIILDTVAMATEGNITIDIDETDPYTDPPRYFIYAEAEGFYSELYYCAKGETINVDLDAIPELANSITGVIFWAPANAADEYYANDTLVITGPGNLSLQTMTDSQGRFGVGNLPLGEFVLTDGYSLTPQIYMQLDNTAETDYISALFYEPTLDRAPYIYLYPETQTDINVQLGLLPGGQVVASIPPYDNGWDVNVTPDGTIDNKYNFLYYEAKQSVPLSYQSGWVLDGNNLEAELHNLLSDLGFINYEIDDFIEYWMPKLGSFDFYAVYPQDVESMVKLNITPQPDNILRTLLLISPLKYKINIPVPEIKDFRRDGFTVAEWGVIWLGN